jgi:3-dehydroquinate synthase
MTDRVQSIILTGFSGTGKSAAAPLVAARLGWEVVDTDVVIEEEAGKTILEIFRDEGEDSFREREGHAIAAGCSRNQVVLSTGGGAILRPENRRRIAEGGFVICLEARPETILRRLDDRAEEEPLDRPLLATPDPLGRIRELKAARQELYALCDWAIHTDSLTPQEVADEVVRAYEAFSPSVARDTNRLAEMSAVHASPEAVVTLHAVQTDAAAIVSTETWSYPVYVEWGLLSQLGSRMRALGLDRQAYVICDETVAHHYEDEVTKSLESASLGFDFYSVAPGEETKTVATAREIYDWLVDHRAERSDAIVAVGGGVTTDLGGYVAATYARGLPLVHVPTSLLGMVDAAIGGKVAVNHPKVKNLIGAFYQPRMVLADPAALRTLPPRELHSGWAEAIKHAMISDEDYLRAFEENAELIGKLDREVVTDMIRRSVAIKAAVVSDDERETTGRRTTLNYGHTLAHAIESTTGYTRFRHGEADGIGMTAAAAISVRMGLLDPALAARQRAVLELYNLPTSAEGLDRERLKAAMALDKKVEGRAIRWVLLEGIGRPILRHDVPEEVVDAALDEVLT